MCQKILIGLLDLLYSSMLYGSIYLYGYANWVKNLLKYTENNGFAQKKPSKYFFLIKIGSHFIYWDFDYKKLIMNLFHESNYRVFHMDGVYCRELLFLMFFSKYFPFIFMLETYVHLHYQKQLSTIYAIHIGHPVVYEPN